MKVSELKAALNTLVDSLENGIEDDKDMMSDEACEKVGELIRQAAQICVMDTWAMAMKKHIDDTLDDD